MEQSAMPPADAGRPPGTAAAGPALEPAAPESGPLDLGHPKGTLAIVALYALLFALGWLALYWWVFVPRGTPHP
jgi:hypothetical protein